MTDQATLYVIDDDQALRDSLGLLLGAHGFEVQVFSSAAEFLSCVSPQNNSGCALIDIHMPGMSGVELLDILAKRGSQFACIMMTGLGDVPLAVKAMKAGAFDFIEKPFNDDALVETIHHAIEQSRKDKSKRGADPLATELLNLLTPREKEVLRQLTLGHANKIIAHELGISPRTVEVHRARLMSKLKAHNVADIVRLGVAAGIVS